VLRKIFGPKKEDITGGQRKLQNEELCNLHSSLNIVRVIKPRGMGWATHVACLGELKNTCYMFGQKISQGEMTWEILV
jgi:hypothetical protein